jgi:hypothetical protein
MPKRILRALDNDRYVTRGLFQNEPRGPFVAIQAEGETDLYRVELDRWLDTGETVSASALSEECGATILKSEGPTYIDLTVSGVSSYGEAKLTVTTSASRVKVIELAWCTPEAVPRRSDSWRFC